MKKQVKNAESPKDGLSRLCAEGGVGFDLEKAVLFVSALFRPSCDLIRCAHILDAIKKDIQPLARERATATAKGALLADILVTDWLFCAEDEEDETPESCDFSHLLERRRAAPPLLGILWIAIGRRVGWEIEALNFPHRFLVRISDDFGKRVVIDPVSAGEEVDPVTLRAFVKLDEGIAAEPRLSYYQPRSDFDLFGDFLAFRKNFLLEKGERRAAAETLDLKTSLFPGDMQGRRELGNLWFRLGENDKAVKMLQSYLKGAPASMERRKAEALLEQIRRREGGGDA